MSRHTAAFWLWFVAVFLPLGLVVQLCLWLLDGCQRVMAWTAPGPVHEVVARLGARGDPFVDRLR